MMKVSIAAFVALVACALANPIPDPGVQRPYGFPYVAPYVHPYAYPYAAYPYAPFYHHGGYGGYPQHAAPSHNGYVFLGHFPGTCHGAPDGLYYVDAANFAFCSNGIKSIQPCAEGSVNPKYGHFHPGRYYNYGDFCSVNLADVTY